MNFEYPAEAESFRAELRAFMREEIPSWWTYILADDERSYEFSRGFCKKLAAKGWLTMGWPEEYGGTGGDVWHQNILREEMWAAGEPRGQQYMSLNFIGPTIMTFGTDEQKDRYLKPMTTGDANWCQGFTEPEAGSDLASLQMSAEQTENGFVLNGHKTWVSYARNAENCILLARTDSDAKKHKGISMFLVSMDTPGLIVRDQPTMAGQSKVQELIFENAEVPADALLGPLHKGWDVTMASLERERVGLAYSARNRLQLDHLLKYVKKARDSTGRLLSERADVRTRITRLKATNRALGLFMNKLVSNQSDEGEALLNSAIYKVLAGDSVTATAELAVELAGPKGLLLKDDPRVRLGIGSYLWWIYGIPVQVAAGPSEIQRNIIAQRGLGLPRG